MRGYIDGAFDLVHAGHFNAIRQGKATCDSLVVGLNSDVSIAAVKGPTVMNDKERATIIKNCKWVDEILPQTQYDVSEEILENMNCDFYIHGDDPCYVNGLDICKKFAEAGKFRMIKRTTGISTTDLTGRLLKLVEENSTDNKERVDGDGPVSPSELTEPPKQAFLQTSERIRNFSNKKGPKPGDTIVYFQSSCDLMHPGVIERLKLAKEQGDFLYVGIWDDDMIRYYRGASYPL